MLTATQSQFIRKRIQQHWWIDHFAWCLGILLRVSHFYGWRCKAMVNGRKNWHLNGTKAHQDIEWNQGDSRQLSCFHELADISLWIARVWWVKRFGYNRIDIELKNTKWRREIVAKNLKLQFVIRKKNKPRCEIFQSLLKLYFIKTFPISISSC